MIEILTVGGISTADYGVYVLSVNDEDMPDRDYEIVSVPGKSGDVHFDNGRYMNKEIVYKCACMKDAKNQVPALCAAIIAKSGYLRIEDSINSDYYKMGEYAGKTVPNFGTFKRAARFDLAFDCKPQKWLKIGEKQITVGSTDKIINPTGFPAYPLLEVTGNGVIGIGGRTLTVANNPGVLMFDCEIGDAYSKTAHANYNQYIQQDTEERYSLAPGDNNITVASGMTLKLTPRWWFI